MKGTIQNLTIRGYECQLYLPPDYSRSSLHYPVIYMNGGDDISSILSDIEEHFVTDCMEFLLLCIQPADWNKDFSPWPAPHVYPKEAPFSGGAPRYLDFLENSVKPIIDAGYRTKPEPDNTAIIGYSLGGLTALYSLYTCSCFGKTASLSGSLWFEGWIEFMEKHMPVNTAARVYLSLGRGEELSRNNALAKVGDCTRKAEELLKEQLNSPGNCILEWNSGGHFAEIEKRIQKAILWLMQR